jgi:hypothetical protein
MAASFQILIRPSLLSFDAMWSRCRYRRKTTTTKKKIHDIECRNNLHRMEVAATKFFQARFNTIFFLSSHIKKCATLIKHLSCPHLKRWVSNRRKVAGLRGKQTELGIPSTHMCRGTQLPTKTSHWKSLFPATVCAPLCLRTSQVPYRQSSQFPHVPAQAWTVGWKINYGLQRIRKEDIT